MGIKNLSFNLKLDRWVRISYSAIIRKSIARNLSLNAQIRNKNTKNLSISSNIEFVSDISFSLFITYHSSIDLNFSSIVRNIGSFDLSTNFKLTKSIRLSYSFVARHDSAKDLSYSFTLRRNSHRMLVDDNIRDWFTSKQVEGTGTLGEAILTNVNPPIQQGVDALQIEIPYGSYMLSRILKHYLQSEDWSRFAQLAFSFWGYNTGASLFFRIFNNSNYRQGEIEDTYSGHRQQVFNIKSLLGSDNFDWKTITDFEMEFSVQGIFVIDKIELLGCRRLSFVAFIRHTTESDLSVSANLRRSVVADLSLNASIANKDSIDLGISAYLIPLQAWWDLPIQGTLRKEYTKDLSISFSITNGSICNMPVSFSIRSPFVKVSLEEIIVDVEARESR